MKPLNSIVKLGLVVVCGFCSVTMAADGELTIKDEKNIKVMKYGKDFKILGIKVARKVYMGQAKVAGKYGAGLVIENDNFIWGINNRGIGFQKRF